jgi:AraC-like DNA-binding protein
VDSFSDDLVSKHTGAFLKAWSGFLASTRKQQHNFRIIHRIFYLLRERLFPFVHGYRNPAYLHNLCLKTEELMENFFLEREMDKKIKNSDMEFKLRDMHEKLHTVVDLQRQMEYIHQGLLAFGIRNLFLSLLGDSGQSRRAARLMLAVRSGRRLEIEKKNCLFAPPRLVPHRGLFDLRERNTMIVSSLFYGEEQLGFMIYNFIGWEPNPYEDLRMILSNALKNALLSAQMQKIAPHQANPDNHPAGVLLETAAAANSTEAGIQCNDLRIQRALDFIREKYQMDITLHDGADKAFMAETYFSKIFKQVTGRGFLECLTAMRIDKACFLLKNSGLKISEIARSVGYHDPDYFYKVFKRRTGRTPSDYRRQELLTNRFRSNSKTPATSLSAQPWLAG